MPKLRKRGHGEGSIHRRADGRWVGAIDLGWHDGKRSRKYIYGATQSEIVERMAVARRAAQEGTLVVDERQTVESFLKQWLENAVARSVRPSTLRRYRDMARLHIIPEIGKIRLAKLSPQHIQSFVNAKVGSKAASTPGRGRPAIDGLSPRTVRHLHALLRSALSQALKWGLVSRNVATLVTLPRVPYREVTPLRTEDARAFLAAAKGHRLEALFAVALAIGLRQGEALGLRWADVDSEARTITVRHALQRIDGKLALVDVKTARARRTVAMPEVVATALRGHLVRQKAERLVAGSAWQDSGLVFTTRVGTGLDARNVQAQFKRLLAHAGLPDQRFHDLRHGAATLLLAQGVAPRGIMEILGHSQIGITMNLYSHVMPELLHDAAARMDRVLAGES